MWDSRDRLVLDRYPKPASHGSEAWRGKPPPSHANRRNPKSAAWPAATNAARACDSAPPSHSLTTFHTSTYVHAAASATRDPRPTAYPNQRPASMWRLRVPTCHPYPQVLYLMAPNDGNALAPSRRSEDDECWNHLGPRSSFSFGWYLAGKPAQPNALDSSTWAARARQDLTR